MLVSVSVKRTRRSLSLEQSERDSDGAKGEIFFFFFLKGVVFLTCLIFSPSVPP